MPRLSAERQSSAAPGPPGAPPLHLPYDLHSGRSSKCNSQLSLSGGANEQLFVFSALFRLLRASAFYRAERRRGAEKYGDINLLYSIGLMPHGPQYARHPGKEALMNIER